MRYKIISTGQIILADQAFVGTYHAGDYTLVPAPVPSAAALRRAEILTRLAQIDETTDKPRTRREMLLAKAQTKAWVQTLDDEATALRTELAGL